MADVKITDLVELTQNDAGDFFLVVDISETGEQNKKIRGDKVYISLSSQIADGIITGDKIASGAVSGAKIASDSIDSQHYVDGSIDSAHIGNSQVTNTKLADASVNSVKIANGSVAEVDLANGAVTWAKRATKEMCRITRLSDQTIGSTLANITFTVESVDTDNMWTSGDPTKMYFRTAGWYLVSGCISYDAGTAGSYRIAAIYRNGSTTSANWVGSQATPAAAGAQMGCSVSSLFYFNANDYIQLKAQCGENETARNAFLSAVRVG